MNDFSPSPDKDPRMFLKNPCVLDVETPVALFSLLMDHEHPDFLFVQIDGEWRKCIRLQGTPTELGNEEEVLEFLRKFRDSEAFQDLIAEEDNLNQGFEEL